MRCHQARRLISEYVDGSLKAGKAAGLEQHVRTCVACRELLGDFRAMAEAAPGLAGPEPGDYIWLKIRRRLSAPEAGSAAASDKAPRAWSFGWSSPALRFAGAAALALILIASGIIVGTRLGRRGSLAIPRNSEKYTLAKLDEAEGYYKKAIASLGEAFASQKGMMVMQAAEMFEKNLAVIDATIQACRQAVLKEPDDLQARNYLLAAYLDKVHILDTALEFSGKNPAAVKRGTTL
jgi:tetratricopeptide (TPR) repeat protein